MNLLIIAAGLLGVVGAFEIRYGARMHELNFQHLMHNHDFHVMVSETDPDDIGPDQLEAFVRHLHDIRRAPEEVLAMSGWFERRMIHLIGAQDALDLCALDIGLADLALARIDAYRAGTITAEALHDDLHRAAHGFLENSDDLAPLVERTVSFATAGTINTLMISALLVAIFGVLISRSVGADYRTIELAERSLEEAKRQAESASEAKTRLVANMSHEIRTPMTAILGFVDLLADPEAGDEEREEAAIIIRRNSNHLLTLLNDILDLAKLEAGRVEIAYERVGVLSLLADIQAMLADVAHGKGLEFECRTERVPAWVYTDPTRVRQILVNLVGNAIKFTERGHVYVSCGFEAGDEQLTITVEDTGIGLTDEQLARLFRPFVQADASTTRHFGGTGLGLTISRHLAELLGGSIDVGSRPGEGSRFVLRLPAEEEAEWTRAGPVGHGDSEAQPTPQSAHDVLAGRRVLVAEDGPDNQTLIRSVLRSAGADVEIVANGREAVDAVHAAPAGYDAILMDMQMPVLDGFAATRELRASGYGGPVIALTANAMVEDRERCLEAGCDVFASKPIRRTTLVETVVAAIEGPGRAAEAERA